MKIFYWIDSSDNNLSRSKNRAILSSTTHLVKKAELEENESKSRLSDDKLHNTPNACNILSRILIDVVVIQCSDGINLRMSGLLLIHLIDETLPAM